MAQRARVPAAFVRAFPARKKHHRRAPFKISLAMVAGSLPMIDHAVIQPIRDGQGFDGIVKRATKVVGYDGYSKTWSFTWMKQSGVFGLLAGMAVHKGANLLGVNRWFARSKLPICI